MKLDLADIATDERKLLKGFKVFGLFPFYIRYIKTRTHIKLCKIQEQIHIVAPEGPQLQDFNNSELQAKIIPLIDEYCCTALVNGRPFAWLFRFFLNKKLKNCGHAHIMNLFLTVYKLNDPAFFFAYWKLIKQSDHTLLKEDDQSSEKSLSIKKNPEPA